MLDLLARGLDNASISRRLVLTENPHEPTFAAVLVPRISAGLVSVCLVTELEVGFAARSVAGFAGVERDILDLMNRLVQPVRAEARAREVQRELMARGHHRAVAVPDLLVAAVAEVAGLTELHHGGDFDLIAAVTGQPTEWIVPPRGG